MQKRAIEIYGQEIIEKEKPLKAELKDDIWYITDTLYCKERTAYLGDVVKVEISKKMTE